MNIVKFGGSVVNPDGKYDESVIAQFIDVVKNSKEDFIFAVGGGKICRFMQNACQKYLEVALSDKDKVDEARDSIGIAATKINARYVMREFIDKLSDEVYPEIILDPSKKIESECRVFIAGGWKPGHSTDKDMMLLAKAYKAEKVFKISNFTHVKRISPIAYHEASDSDKKTMLSGAEDISEMTWNELQKLVGSDWKAGLNTPFDPEATKIGVELSKTVEVCIGTKEAFLESIEGKEFSGTIVRG